MNVATAFKGANGVTVYQLAQALLKLNGYVAPSAVLAIADGPDSIRPVQTVSLGHAERVGKGKYRYSPERVPGVRPMCLLLQGGAQ